MDEQGRSVKAGFWYIIGNFMMSGVSFLVTPFYARLLSQEQYGYYTTFVSFQTILFAILSLQIYTSVGRAKFDFKGKIDEFISSLLLFYLGVSLISIGIVCACMDLLVEMVELPQQYIYLILGYVMFYPAFRILQAKHNSYFEYKKFTLFAIIFSIVPVLIGLRLSLKMDDSLDGRLIGEQVTVILFSVIVYIVLLLKGRKFKWRYVRYTLPIAMPLIPHILAMELLSLSDRIMIQKICGAEEAALYGMAYNIGFVVNVVWNSMNQAWSPWFGERMYNKEYEVIRSYAYKYLGVFLLIACGCILIAPELLYFLGDKTYMQAQDIIPYVILSCVLQFVYSMYVNIEMFEKKTTYVPIGTGLAAFINIVLNALLLPIYGYKVAAITTVIGYLCLYLFHLVIVKLLRFHFVFDNGKIFGIVLIVFLVCLLVRVLYEFSNLRYIFIMVYAIFLISIGVYIFRKKDVWKEKRL